MKKITLKKTDLTLIRSEARFKIDYRAELNEAQYEAVMHETGPALVIAGAGTGKTRALTYRVARLIESGWPPESILLLTFTRKAAKEMLRRASVLLDERTERVEGGTFHAFANRTLRYYAAKVSYTPEFTILDQGDAEDVVNLLRNRMGGASTDRRFPKKQTLLKMYSTAVNTLTPLEQVIAKDYPQFNSLYEPIAALAQAYVVFKRQNNNMDYDDLLVNLVTLMEQNEDLRRRISERHRQILVDEYQDSNALQARIVQLLGGSHGNVMAVGDDSQSIYAFRGANFRNIMDFPRQFNGCRVITLEENYRSTQPILDFTNRVIESAAEKYSKRLFTSRQEGAAPMLISAATENVQSRFIVQTVLELREEGVPLEEMAVLFRAGYQSFDLEIELARANIPYVKFGGLKLMETAHVKDVLAHLRAIENPKDVISWTRILLLVDSVGPASAERITDAIIEGLNPLSDRAMDRIRGLAKGTAGIAILLDALRGAADEKMSVADRIARLLGYYLPLMKDMYDDYPKRIKDLETLQAISERYRSVQNFLSDMALEPPTESVEDLTRESKEREFLTLSTIHSAKGLEWNTVFVIHLLDGKFPLTSAADTFETMEEERRLFYVACTRAKRRLYLTHPQVMYDRATGSILGKPSRFLDVIPDGMMEAYSVEEE